MARYSFHPILLPLSYGCFEVDLLPSCCLLKEAKREKVGRKSRRGKGEERWMSVVLMTLMTKAHNDTRDTRNSEGGGANRRIDYGSGNRTEDFSFLTILR
jgi:hypothetical protein